MTPTTEATVQPSTSTAATESIQNIVAATVVAPMVSSDKKIATTSKKTTVVAPALDDDTSSSSSDENDVEQFLKPKQKTPAEAKISKKATTSKVVPEQAAPRVTRSTAKREAQVEALGLHQHMVHGNEVSMEDFNKEKKLIKKKNRKNSISI